MIAKAFPDPAPFWPIDELTADPKSNGGTYGIEVISFPDVKTVPYLKRAAARTGVRTINALVHAASLVALYSTCHEEGLLENRVIKCNTPISVREAKRKGHGLWTGNYVGIVSLVSSKAVK